MPSPKDPAAVPRGGIGEADLINWFTYHPPTAEDTVAYQEIRKAALDFVRVILRETPICADQTVAVRKVREAVFCANAARACGGK